MFSPGGRPVTLRKASVVGVTVAAVLTLTACSGPAPSPRLAVAVDTAATPGNGMIARTTLYSMRAGATTTALPTVSDKNVATCQPSQLATTATQESGAASHRGIVVAFRETGATACSIEGFSTTWFVNAAGDRLGDVSTETGAAASLVTLKPNELASTTVWTADPRMVAGGAVGAACQPETATGIDLTLPGQSVVVIVPIVVSVCTTSPAVPWTTPVRAGTEEWTY
jgi:hypothetical protein